jgi:hypothetical protein
MMQAALTGGPLDGVVVNIAPFHGDPPTVVAHVDLGPGQPTRSATYAPDIDGGFPLYDQDGRIIYRPAG